MEGTTTDGASTAVTHDKTIAPVTPPLNPTLYERLMAEHDLTECTVTIPKLNDKQLQFLARHATVVVRLDKRTVNATRRWFLASVPTSSDIAGENPLVARLQLDAKLRAQCGFVYREFCINIERLSPAVESNHQESDVEDGVKLAIDEMSDDIVSETVRCDNVADGGERARDTFTEVDSASTSDASKSDVVSGNVSENASSTLLFVVDESLDSTMTQNADVTNSTCALEDGRASTVESDVATSLTVMSADIATTAAETSNVCTDMETVEPNMENTDSTATGVTVGVTADTENKPVTELVTEPVTEPVVKPKRRRRGAKKATSGDGVLPPVRRTLRRSRNANHHAVDDASVVSRVAAADQSGDVAKRATR